MDADYLLRQKYAWQRSAAKRRGIEWCFTFESWLAVWVASGRFDERGRAGDSFVMARNGDTGPYAANNVRIIRMRENSSETHANYQMNLKRRGTGRGWTRVGSKFQAAYRRKYLGIFATQAEAERAVALARSQVAAA